MICTHKATRALILAVVVVLVMTVTVVGSAPIETEAGPGLAQFVAEENHQGFFPPVSQTSAPAQVTLAGQIGGWIQAATIRGRYLYAMHGPRLDVLDIVDPTTPLSVGSSEVFGGWVADVSQTGDRLYVVSGYGGLDILDISDPIRPMTLGHWGYNRYAAIVEASTTIAYVADLGRVLSVVDASNPQFPVEIGSWASPSGVEDMVLAGNYLYVATFRHGLMILDVTNPTQPRVVGRFVPPGDRVGSVKVEGTIAFVTDATVLRTLDVSDPTRPRQLGTYAFIPASTRVVVTALSSSVAYLWTVEGDSLEMVDVSNLSQPNFLGTYDQVRGRVVVAGDRAYSTANNRHDLIVLDVADPAMPTQIGAFRTVGWVNLGSVVGDTVYLATEGDFPDTPLSLQVVDARDPSRLTLIGTQDFEQSSVSDFSVAETPTRTARFAFVAARDFGLRIIDVTDPEAMSETSTVAIPSWAVEVDLSSLPESTEQRILAHVTNHSGLRIIDVTNPLEPAVVGSYDIPIGQSPMAKSANAVYVVDTNHVIRIVDVSNPGAPVEIGSYGLGNGVGVNDMAVACTAYRADRATGSCYLYVVTFDSTVRIVDVSNPTLPVEVQPALYVSAARSIAVADDLVYVSNFLGEIRAFDMADPTRPLGLGVVKTPGSVNDMQAIGRRLFAVDGSLLITQLAVRIHFPVGLRNNR